MTFKQLRISGFIPLYIETLFFSKTWQTATSNISAGMVAYIIDDNIKQTVLSKHRLVSGISYFPYLIAYIIDDNIKETVLSKHRLVSGVSYFPCCRPTEMNMCLFSTDLQHTTIPTTGNESGYNENGMVIMHMRVLT